MKYETVKLLKNSDFKRLTGVHRSTFEKMLKVVQTSLRNFGRPPKLVFFNHTNYNIHIFYNDDKINTTTLRGG